MSRASEARRAVGRDQRGFGLAESVVGAAVGLLAVLAMLALASGLTRIGRDTARRVTTAIAASRAVEAIAATVERAGEGIDPQGLGDPADEPIELATFAAIGVRGDLDGDDPSRSGDPERMIAPPGAIVTTGNDEIVVFLRRNRSARGRGTAEFFADVDGPERVTLTDGTVVALRDGVAESVSAGPVAEEGESPGVLYRVAFVHDSSRYGGGRFRTSQPMLDGVSALRVAYYDDDGSRVADCGGGEEWSARACRRSIASIEIEVETERGSVAARRVWLARARPSGWRDEWGEP